MVGARKLLLDGLRAVANEVARKLVDNNMQSQGIVDINVTVPSPFGDEQRKSLITTLHCRPNSFISPITVNSVGTTYLKVLLFM